MILNKDVTSQSIYFVIVENADGTNPGDPKTGLTNSDITSAYYTRAGASPVSISLSALAAANSAFSSGGFKEVHATHSPGLYRLDVPNAAFAHGANSVVIQLNVAGAANAKAEPKEISLLDDYSARFDTVDYALTSNNADIASLLFSSDQILSDMSTLLTQQARLLGLSHENMYMDNFSFSDTNKLLSCRSRLFSSNAFDPDSDTPIAIYDTTITYDGDDAMLSWEMRRIA